MKRWLGWIVPIAALVTMGSGAMAQFGQGMPPEVQAKMKAWQKWRENHKHVEALGKTLRAYREMEKDPKTQLTKDQARKIVPVLKAWREKPVMSDDQALQVNKQLTGPLNVEQIKKLVSIPDFGRGGRGFGGGARPGGGGPGGGGGRPGGGFDMSRFPDPKDYNPLNPDSSPFKTMNPEMFQRIKTSYNELVVSLEARAK